MLLALPWNGTDLEYGVPRWRCSVGYPLAVDFMSASCKCTCSVANGIHPNQTASAAGFAADASHARHQFEQACNRLDVPAGRRS